MDTKNELDELLKKHMEFRKDEQIEPNPSIQNELRKKVQLRKKATTYHLLDNLKNWLTVDIKLYQAGLAMSLVAILLITLRPVSEPLKNKEAGIMIADTTVTTNSNSIKQDSFLVKNFSVNMN
jgi:hypothetical protein